MPDTVDSLKVDILEAQSKHKPCETYEHRVKELWKSLNEGSICPVHVRTYDDMLFALNILKKYPKPQATASDSHLQQ